MQTSHESHASLGGGLFNETRPISAIISGDFVSGVSL